MILNAEVNYLAVLVATIAAFLVGSIWHGPLFGKLWMRLSGIKMPKKMTPEVQKQMWKSMILGFISTLICAWVLAMVLLSVGAVHALQAMCAAFFLWLGFTGMMCFAGYIWEQKSFRLFVFNAAYRLVEILVMALVLGAWR
jgi:hypothetical protein